MKTASALLASLLVPMLGAMALAPPAWSQQTYPARPIRLVVPF